MLELGGIIIKGLQITIDIEQDEKVREYVKELIAAQVKSVTREEIKKIVEETVTAKMPHITEATVYNELKSQISSALNKNDIVVNGRRYTYLQSLIQAEIKELIGASVNNIDEAIKTAVLTSLKRS